jgi:tRNA dimethylallyltransferase
LSHYDFLVVAGPTCSGKSDYALNFALQNSGEIINSDSMQVYQDLKILTARPNDYSVELIPHHLYGVTSEPITVQWWLENVVENIKQVISKGKLPIVVGGTGFYISALLDGISQIPSIDQNVRDLVRNEQQQLNYQDFFQKVVSLDSLVIDKINPKDKVRLSRAYEVFLQTGNSITFFQGNPKKLTHLKAQKLLLNLDKLSLHDKIIRRTKMMIKNGVIEEVKILLQKKMSKNLGVMSAIGVYEIEKFLNGFINMEDLEQEINLRTRQYAKRQMTWFRNRYSHDKLISFNT